jgi:hypothetical protein
VRVVWQAELLLASRPNVFRPAQYPDSKWKNEQTDLVSRFANLG